MIHLLWGSKLFDLAFIHNRYSAGDLERLFLIVGDEYSCQAKTLMQPSQPLPQLLAQLGIQSAERFIEEQYVRFDRECSRKGDTLPLSAGELRGITIGGPFELYEFEQFPDPPSNLRLG